MTTAMTTTITTTSDPRKPYRTSAPPAAVSVFPVGGAVPVPNSLFDRWLPALRDTELRVLLVVLRQTLGWREGERRYRERDWLSSSQMMRRTGRASEAVSRAVDSLVLLGLIGVEDAGGKPLATAAARRAHLGRLYYRIREALTSEERSDAAPVAAPVEKWKSAARCRSAKAKTTTDRPNNINNNSSISNADGNVSGITSERDIADTSHRSDSHGRQRRGGWEKVDRVTRAR